MARSQQSVYLQTYLTDAIAEEVAKHGRHNQKSHGKRGGKRGGGIGKGPMGEIRAARAVAGVAAGNMRRNRELSRQGAPTGRTRTLGALEIRGGQARMANVQQTQVRMTRGERATTAAIGVGATAFAAVSRTGLGGRTGVNMIASAVRGKAWVNTDSARASGAVGRRSANKAAGGGKKTGGTSPLPASVVSQLRSGYRQWLTATGRSDSDEAAREYAAAVLAAANRG
jgi:hypothetical protein